MTIRVLIADPDEALLDSYRDYLTRNGFEVRTATSMRECVDQLAPHLPHAVVLELDLPASGDDTLEFVSFILNDEEAPLVPVLVLTADDNPLTLEGMPFLASEHRVKPVAPGELADQVRRMVEPRGRRHRGGHDSLPEPRGSYRRFDLRRLSRSLEMSS